MKGKIGMKKAALALALMLALGLFGCGTKTPGGGDVSGSGSGETGDISSGSQSAAVSEPGSMELPYDLRGGLLVTEMRRYAGIFMEDGTDQIVDSIMMIVVENTGEEYIQLAGISLTDTECGSYTFLLTTLFPGEKAALLELNRAVWQEDIVLEKGELTSVALFEEEPSMYPEMLEFREGNYQLAVKNISGQDFAGGRVCYKSTSGDLYIGGITYTVTIPALAPGQEVTLSARHYMEGGSKLVFVSYAE